MKNLTKSEKREEKRLKKKRAPKGGTLAGMRKRLETTKGYKGVAKKMIKK